PACGTFADIYVNTGPHAAGGVLVGSQLHQIDALSGELIRVVPLEEAVYGDIAFGDPTGGDQAVLYGVRYSFDDDYNLEPPHHIEVIDAETGVASNRVDLQHPGGLVPNALSWVSGAGLVV